MFFIYPGVFDFSNELGLLNWFSYFVFLFILSFFFPLLFYLIILLLLLSYYLTDALLAFKIMSPYHHIIIVIIVIIPFFSLAASFFFKFFSKFFAFSFSFSFSCSCSCSYSFNVLLPFIKKIIWHPLTSIDIHWHSIPCTAACVSTSFFTACKDTRQI